MYICFSKNLLMNSKEKVIQNTINYVKSVLKDAEGGHDWWHIYRVWNTAKQISIQENADGFIVELGALLHDIADSKFYEGDETIGPNLAKRFLVSQEVEEQTINHIVNIIENVSFKGGKERQQFHSKEFYVIQDADRLDAMGAIGIARAFNYGGFKNREIYNPEIKPNLKMSKEEYKNSEAPSLNHFYEKLLLLKDRMNTETGKQLAKNRHEFMEKYLEQFYLEWDGRGSD